MKFTMTKLKRELLAKVDKTSQVQLEKVERYLNLVKLYYELDEFLKREGLLVKTVNGSQEFLKTNPALQEKAKINTQILAIEKSFNFEVENKIDDSGGGDLI